MKNPRHDLYSSRLVTSLEILHASKRKHQKTSMPLKSGSKPPRTLTLRRNVAGGVWSTTFCPLGGGIPTRIAVGMMGWWWVDVIHFFLWKSEIWEIRHLYFEIWDPPNFFLTLDPKNLLCICYYTLLFGRLENPRFQQFPGRRQLGLPDSGSQKVPRKQWRIQRCQWCWLEWVTFGVIAGDTLNLVLLEPCFLFF